MAAPASSLIDSWVQPPLMVRDDEQVATVLSFGYPADPADPERRTPEEWIARAGRLPFDEVVELR